MRRSLIQVVLPTLFCLLPLCAALVIAVAVPTAALQFYVTHLSPMDWLILGLGVVLFCAQTIGAWRALQWRSTTFDETPDRFLSNLAQAAEWFPLLGLLGTVAGILQTFSSISGPVEPARIVNLYAPAITATGSGLFMALINILPTWMVLFGRELILTLAGGEMPSVEVAP